MKSFLEAETPQERRKRAAGAYALLLVSAVALVKYVTGVTLDSAPFTLYALAVAASAARGGFGPGLVATLASVVLAVLESGIEVPVGSKVLFLLEGISVALIVSAIRSHVQARDGQLRAMEAANAGLRRHDRDGRLADAALRHLELAADDRAVALLDDQGVISGWGRGAERLYGYSAQEAIGTSVASLFLETPSPEDVAALLQLAVEGGFVRRSELHRRSDGAGVAVDYEIRPFRTLYSRGFTLAAHDLAGARAWDDYRRAAAEAQAALQRAADDARQQLAALENLTDPELNPFEGAGAVTELLERLRTAVRGDGVALAHSRRHGTGLVAARGLGPAVSRKAGEPRELTPGRVAMVHNDAVRVAELSALDWPPEVTSLLAVPVVHDGDVWATIEVVGERSRQVSDWDVALARIVADRLAAVVVQHRALEKAS